MATQGRPPHPPVDLDTGEVEQAPPFGPSPVGASQLEENRMGVNLKSPIGKLSIERPSNSRGE
jgi:hypothetical protein